MNNTLLKKLLAKTTLKDLFDEIKKSDELLFSLGEIIMEKRKDLFISLVKDCVLEVIESEDKTLSEWLKLEIINMDEGESVNPARKRKALKSTKPPVTDPCGSYGGGGPRC